MERLNSLIYTTAASRQQYNERENPIALMMRNADHKWWTKHVSSFLGSSAEVFALTVKIRNNSPELPRFHGFLYLRGADLQEANLRGTWLQGAYLERADLRNADLQYADLRGVNLSEAHLQRADLTGANLQGAHLIRANLFGAYLQGAHLIRANLERAWLREAQLQGVELHYANLEEASLTGADLTGAHLEGADLEGADLRDTILDLSRYGLPQDFLTDSQLKMLTNDKFRDFFTCLINRLVEINKNLEELKPIVERAINGLPDLAIIDRMNSDEINQLCDEIFSYYSQPPPTHLEFSVRPSVRPSIQPTN